jgi:hypothetical protein
LYKDCNYFGLETERVSGSSSRRINDFEVFEESKFVVSNEWREMAFGTGVNFCHKSFADFHYVVEMINDFIQQTKIDAHLVPSVSVAYPILNPVAKGHGHINIAAVGGGVCDAEDNGNCTATAVVQPLGEVVADVSDAAALSAAGGCGEGDFTMPCAKSLE